MKVQYKNKQIIRAFEFTLQGKKSLDGNGTQGSIHGRASSSDFDTLIFQPFGRCPHLFLPHAAVNSTGLSNSASPTFVNRNLEPYRGYHIFLRALPEILRQRPRARVLIVGGDDVSYGARPEGERKWKDIFASEVRPQISDADWARVHFLGHIPYQHFIPLLQLSTVHVYLTYPFVLSWSLLEAMSVGCAIVASDTQPLREAVRQDETGRLVDFFDVPSLAREVCALLDDPATRARLGANARAFAQANYDLQTVCLPRQLQWVQGLAGGGRSRKESVRIISN